MYSCTTVHPLRSVVAASSPHHRQSLYPKATRRGSMSSPHSVQVQRRVFTWPISNSPCPRKQGSLVVEACPIPAGVSIGHAEYFVRQPSGTGSVPLSLQLVLQCSGTGEAIDGCCAHVDSFAVRPNIVRLVGCLPCSRGDLPLETIVYHNVMW